MTRVEYIQTLAIGLAMITTVIVIVRPLVAVYAAAGNVEKTSLLEKALVAHRSNGIISGSLQFVLAFVEACHK
jgi:hypothetical protein